MLRYTDCIEPSFGHINEDGYVRVLDKPRSVGGKLKMHHRQEWERLVGPIPEGFEINHLCKNRKCCNVEHLECIHKSEHKSKDNSLRYRERIEEVLKFKQDNPEVTQYELAEKFNMSQSGIWHLFNREVEGGWYRYKAS